MKDISKKMVTAIFTLLTVSFLVFFAFSVIPGDPALSKLGTHATPERLAALRSEMGLDRPFFVRFGEWIWNALQGDFGISYSYSMPVRQMIADKIPVTLTLALYSFLMMLFFSIVIGIYTARHAGGIMDRIILVLNQAVMSIPPFFSGILITLIFGMILHVFTPGGYISYRNDPAGFFAYLFFPAFSIALPKTAMAVKLLRSSLLEEMKKDYVRTAYSRGNRTRDVFYRHVLKNAAIPLVTFVGMALTDMIAGSIVIEQVFRIPGLGRILLSSIQNRDYPVVEAVIICIAFFVIAVNFLVDLLYHRLDPRIRLK